MKTSQNYSKKMLVMSSRVSKSIRILDVRLLEAENKLGNLELPVEVSLNWHTVTTRNTKRKEVSVRPTFDLAATSPKFENEPGFSIRASFEVMYKIPSFDGIGEEDLEAFGRLNGVHNAWPYWREFVQSMTTRMGLPPLTVPVYNPAGKPDELGSTQKIPKRKATKKKVAKKKTTR